MMTQRSRFFMVSGAWVLGSLIAACSSTGNEGTGGSGGAAGSGSSSSASGAGGAGGSGGATGSGGGGGSVACDPMNLPPEGSPCATEGEFCGSGCEDPCSFCNILQCTNGTWQGAEVFPAPCLSCEDVCVPVVAAQCAGGPPDQAACVQGCNQNQMGACKILFNQMLACIGSTPTVTCDAMSRPTVAGCEKQFDDLYACIML